MDENTELSPVEQEAISLGWQPEEAFKADPKNEGRRWRTAEDFMDRKPLFDKIDSQSRELKHMKQTLNQLVRQNQEVEKLAYQKALDDLKAMKRIALDEGDHDKVVEIDERIQEIKLSPPKQESPAAQNEAFIEWVKENSWYNTDTKMRHVADGIGLSLAREGRSQEEVLREVSVQIKEIFPDKFHRRVPPAPEGSSNKKGGGGKDVKSLLTDQERRIMDTIVRTGLSEDEYLKQFVAINQNDARFKGVKL